MLKRRIEPIIQDDLRRKMVLLAGPRQCGKTSLSLEFLNLFSGHYYTWDSAADRKTLINEKLNSESKLWIFDELHKYRRWRNWLKGVFDQNRSKHSILVTGSARLDLYSRGGDSLQGRYFFHRLHPFTLSEVLGEKFLSDHDWLKNIGMSSSHSGQSDLDGLFKLGGFPEPFSSASERLSDRWRLRYGTQLVREEVKSLEAVQDLDRIELLFDRLAQTVGSTLSINNLREDLEVSHVTVQNWIRILERLYGVFRVPPFGPVKIKAVKKETKLYFWDWARVEDPGARFENLVAVHLLRFAHWLEDVEGKKCELRYFRTTVGHEVDFIFLIKGVPVFAVEVELSDRPLDTNLKYLLERIKIPMAFQISKNGTNDFLSPPFGGCRVRVMPAEKFLRSLP